MKASDALKIAKDQELDRILNGIKWLAELGATRADRPFRAEKKTIDGLRARGFEIEEIPQYKGHWWWRRLDYMTYKVSWDNPVAVLAIVKEP